MYDEDYFRLPREHTTPLDWERVPLPHTREKAPVKAGINPLWMERYIPYPSHELEGCLHWFVRFPKTKQESD